MKFQPGQSGNPAGRPPGSLNKKTLAAQAQLEERTQEIVDKLVERANNGDAAATRTCMERLAPTGRNRRVAIELPVIKTAEDAELALAVVTDELAAGKLTIAEASAMVMLIDRMLQVAERMWNFARLCSYDAKRDAILLDDEDAPEGAADAAKTAEPPSAPLYSPVNSDVPNAPRGEIGAAQSGAPGLKEPLPLSRAA